MINPYVYSAGYNPLIESWIPRVVSAGFTLPASDRLALLSLAWDYVDANSSTNLFDFVAAFNSLTDGWGLVPFINSAGAVNITKVGAVVHTPGGGYASTANSIYLATGWIPNTHGVQYTQNNAHHGGGTDYTLTNGNRAYGEIAATGNLGNMQLIFRTSGVNGPVACINSSGPSILGTRPSAITQGRYLIVRTASNNFSGYFNGALTGSLSTAAAARSTREVWLCKVNNETGTQNFFPGNIQYFTAGANINPTVYDTFIQKLLQV